MIDILKSEQKNCKFPALLHCFSSSAELANIAIDLDIKISVAGIVTFKNAKELQDIIKNIPLEYLMIETDSPYLAPVPYRGQVNQPAFVIEVAKMIAVIKNLDLATILSQTTSNFLSIFKKVVL
jgi:TatD DNase family protein